MATSQRSSSPSSLAGGIKARLSSVAAAYERSGGLWGTVARLAGATSQQRQPQRHSPQQYGQPTQDHQATPPMPPMPLHGTQDEKGPAYNNAQTQKCADSRDSNDFDNAESFAALFDRVGDEGPSTDITDSEAASASNRADAFSTSAGGIRCRPVNRSNTTDKYKDLFDF
eukprot:INCI18860.1.p1 GENE.INCI18860.1~~INCI18860.1.p1  ORF type:complete len:170 (+),score=24.12 INCI18860.1:298-807(+)